MVYRERIEVVITLKENEDTDAILPVIEAAGVENCEVNRAIRMIIGYIATMNTSDRRSVYDRLHEISGVQDISTAVIYNALKED